MFSVLLKYIRLATLIGAVLSVFAAGYFLIKELRFVSNASVADGTVVDFYDCSMSGFSRRYGISSGPIVEYMADGALVRFKSNVCSTGGGGYIYGDHVKVLYDPADPGRARIDRFINRHAMTVGWVIMFCISGIGLILAKFINKLRIRT